MTRIYVATGDALAVIGRANGGWRARLALVGKHTYCLAADPRRPERVYCGTFGQGLWRSDDAGATWQPTGPGIASDAVMSVAVGPDGVVWAGTEPSMLYRSEDGGDTWTACPALGELPSAPTWSFPPRPWTHHVRWIAPDPTEAGRVFVGIELGGVMRSLDGGRTWEDRKPGSQPDAHTLATHPAAPGAVYEAAGGGFAETRDGGATWRGHDAGLRWRYLWGLAVDPGDPDVLVVSASPGPREAHDERTARADPPPRRRRPVGAGGRRAARRAGDARLRAGVARGRARRFLRCAARRPRPPLRRRRPVVGAAPDRLAERVRGQGGQRAAGNGGALTRGRRR